MEISKGCCRGVVEQMEELIFIIFKSSHAMDTKNLNFCVRDLVIISVSLVPQSHWPTRHIEMCLGQDGVSHSIKLKTSNSELS